VLLLEAALKIRRDLGARLGHGEGPRPDECGCGVGGSLSYRHAINFRLPSIATSYSRASTRMSPVSVILVGHNSRPFLERALASLCEEAPERSPRPVEVGDERGGLAPARQAGSDLDLVLVDNASTDGTADLVRARFPRCRVIEAGENLGFGRACNLGVRESTGEHILFLNPDAWVDPSCIDHLRRAMQSDPRIGWAAPRLFYPDGRRQFIWAPTVGVVGEALRLLRNRFERRQWSHGLLPRALRALGDPGWYTAACALLRRRAWDEVGGFDPGFFLYFEDADLGLRLRQAGWRLAQVAEARAYHDRHLPSASSGAMAHYRESQLRYYRKHRPRWENRVLLRKQTREARNVADEAMRARLLEVCGRAREALESRVVDLPGGGALDERGGVLAPAKGLVELSKDFEEPLPDFEDYR
jgi:GT2 family glycosyltransferase